jgi:hypothetical protein
MPCIDLEDAVASGLVVSDAQRKSWGAPTISGNAVDTFSICPFCGRRLGGWHVIRAKAQLRKARRAVFLASDSDRDALAANQVAAMLGEQSGLMVKPMALALSEDARGVLWKAPRSRWRRPCVAVVAEATCASGMEVYATLTLWRGRPITLELGRGDGRSAHAEGLIDSTWRIVSQRRSWRLRKPC